MIISLHIIAEGYKMAIEQSFMVLWPEIQPSQYAFSEINELRIHNTPVEITQLFE